MIIKSGVLEVIEKFNKSNHGTRAEFVSSKADQIVIRFSGLFCRNADDCYEFPAFRALLEAKVLRQVNIKESVRTGPEEHRVVYTIGEDGPAETILNILGRYDEGVETPGGEFED